MKMIPKLSNYNPNPNELSGVADQIVMDREKRPT